MAALLGGLDDRNLGVLAAWMVVVLISVLAHELGHATTALLFGLTPRIELYAMGGTTSWSAPKAPSRARRIIITLAGPAAGFVFAGAVLLLHASFGSRLFAGAIGAYAYASLLAVNVGWGVLNLLPMLPLDGGNVLLQVLHGATGERGERPARIVSIVVALAGVVLGLIAHSLWPAFLSASFIFSNARALSDLAAADHDAPMRAALEQAYVALDAKNGFRVLELARPAALSARTEPVRAEALQLLAFGFLLEGRLADAEAAIAAMPQGYTPHPSLLHLRSATRGATPS